MEKQQPVPVSSPAGERSADAGQADATQASSGFDKESYWTISYGALLTKVVSRTSNDWLLFCRCAAEDPQAGPYLRTALMQYCRHTREIFLKAAVIEDLLSDNKPVESLIQSLISLVRKKENLASLFEQELWSTNQEVVGYNLPKSEVAVAIDVLATGGYPRLPKMLEKLVSRPNSMILPEFSAEDRLSLRLRLEDELLIHFFASKCPKDRTFFKLRKGRVIIEVKGEFVLLGVSDLSKLKLLDGGLFVLDTFGNPLGNKFSQLFLYVVAQDIELHLVKKLLYSSMQTSTPSTVDTSKQLHDEEPKQQQSRTPPLDFVIESTALACIRPSLSEAEEAASKNSAERPLGTSANAVTKSEKFSSSYDATHSASREGIAVAASSSPEKLHHVEDFSSQSASMYSSPVNYSSSSSYSASYSSSANYIASASSHNMPPKSSPSNSPIHPATNCFLRNEHARNLHEINEAHAHNLMPEGSKMAEFSHKGGSVSLQDEGDVQPQTMEAAPHSPVKPLHSSPLEKYTSMRDIFYEVYLTGHKLSSKIRLDCMKEEAFQLKHIKHKVFEVTFSSLSVFSAEPRPWLTSRYQSSRKVRHEQYTEKMIAPLSSSSGTVEVPPSGMIVGMRPTPPPSELLAGISRLSNKLCSTILLESGFNLQRSTISSCALVFENIFRLEVGFFERFDASFGGAFSSDLRWITLERPSTNTFIQRGSSFTPNYTGKVLGGGSISFGNFVKKDNHTKDTAGDANEEGLGIMSSSNEAASFFENHSELSNMLHDNNLSAAHSGVYTLDSSLLKSCFLTFEMNPETGDLFSECWPVHLLFKHYNALMKEDSSNDHISLLKVGELLFSILTKVSRSWIYEKILSLLNAEEGQGLDYWIRSHTYLASVYQLFSLEHMLLHGETMQVFGKGRDAYPDNGKVQIVQPPFAAQSCNRVFPKTQNDEEFLGCLFLRARFYGKLCDFSIDTFTGDLVMEAGWIPARLIGGEYDKGAVGGNYNSGRNAAVNISGDVANVMHILPYVKQLAFCFVLNEAFSAVGINFMPLSSLEWLKDWDFPLDKHLISLFREYSNDDGKTKVQQNSALTSSAAFESYQGLCGLWENASTELSTALKSYLGITGRIFKPETDEAAIVGNIWNSCSKFFYKVSSASSMNDSGIRSNRYLFSPDKNAVGSIISSNSSVGDGRHSSAPSTVLALLVYKNLVLSSYLLFNRSAQPGKIELGSGAEESLIGISSSRVKHEESFEARSFIGARNSEPTTTSIIAEIRLKHPPFAIFSNDFLHVKEGNTTDFSIPSSACLASCFKGRCSDSSSGSFSSADKLFATNSKENSCKDSVGATDASVEESSNTIGARVACITPQYFAQCVSHTLKKWNNGLRRLEYFFSAVKASGGCFRSLKYGISLLDIYSEYESRKMGFSSSKAKISNDYQPSNTILPRTSQRRIYLSHSRSNLAENLHTSIDKGLGYTIRILEEENLIRIRCLVLAENADLGAVGCDNSYAFWNTSDKLLANDKASQDNSGSQERPIKAGKMEGIEATADMKNPDPCEFQLCSSWRALIQLSHNKLRNNLDDTMRDPVFWSSKHLLPFFDVLVACDGNFMALRVDEDFTLFPRLWPINTLNCTKGNTNGLLEEGVVTVPFQGFDYIMTLGCDIRHFEASNSSSSPSKGDKLSGQGPEASILWRKHSSNSLSIEIPLNPCNTSETSPDTPLEFSNPAVAPSIILMLRILCMNHICKEAEAISTLYPRSFSIDTSSPFELQITHNSWMSNANPGGDLSASSTLFMAQKLSEILPFVSGSSYSRGPLLESSELRCSSDAPTPKKHDFYDFERNPIISPSKISSMCLLRMQINPLEDLRLPIIQPPNEYALNYKRNCNLQARDESSRPVISKVFAWCKLSLTVEAYGLPVYNPGSIPNVGKNDATQLEHDDLVRSRLFGQDTAKNSSYPTDFEKERLAYLEKMVNSSCSIFKALKLLIATFELASIMRLLANQHPSFAVYDPLPRILNPSPMRWINWTCEAYMQAKEKEGQLSSYSTHQAMQLPSWKLQEKMIKGEEFAGHGGLIPLVSALYDVAPGAHASENLSIPPDSLITASSLSASSFIQVQDLSGFSALQFSAKNKLNLSSKTNRMSYTSHIPCNINLFSSSSFSWICSAVNSMGLANGVEMGSKFFPFHVPTDSLDEMRNSSDFEEVMHSGSFRFSLPCSRSLLDSQAGCHISVRLKINPRCLFNLEITAVCENNDAAGESFGAYLSKFCRNISAKSPLLSPSTLHKSGSGSDFGDNGIERSSFSSWIAFGDEYGLKTTDSWPEWWLPQAAGLYFCDILGSQRLNFEDNSASKYSSSLLSSCLKKMQSGTGSKSRYSTLGVSGNITGEMLKATRIQSFISKNKSFGSFKLTEEPGKLQFYGSSLLFQPGRLLSTVILPFLEFCVSWRNFWIGCSVLNTAHGAVIPESLPRFEQPNHLGVKQEPQKSGATKRISKFPEAMVGKSYSSSTGDCAFTVDPSVTLPREVPLKLHSSELGSTNSLQGFGKFQSIKTGEVGYENLKRKETGTLAGSIQRLADPETHMSSTKADTLRFHSEMSEYRRKVSLEDTLLCAKTFSLRYMKNSNGIRGGSASVPEITTAVTLNLCTSYLEGRKATILAHTRSREILRNHYHFPLKGTHWTAKKACSVADEHADGANNLVRRKNRAEISIGDSEDVGSKKKRKMASNENLTGSQTIIPTSFPGFSCLDSAVSSNFEAQDKNSYLAHGQEHELQLPGPSKGKISAETLASEFSTSEQEPLVVEELKRFAYNGINVLSHLMAEILCCNLSAGVPHDHFLMQNSDDKAYAAASKASSRGQEESWDWLPEFVHLDLFCYVMDLQVAAALTDITKTNRTYPSSKCLPIPLDGLVTAIISLSEGKYDFEGFPPATKSKLYSASFEKGASTPQKLFSVSAKTSQLLQTKTASFSHQSGVSAVDCLATREAVESNFCEDSGSFEENSVQFFTFSDSSFFPNPLLPNVSVKKSSGVAKKEEQLTDFNQKSADFDEECRELLPFFSLDLKIDVQASAVQLISQYIKIWGAHLPAADIQVFFGILKLSLEKHRSLLFDIASILQPVVLSYLDRAAVMLGFSAKRGRIPYFEVKFNAGYQPAASTLDSSGHELFNKFEVRFSIWRELDPVIGRINWLRSFLSEQTSDREFKLGPTALDITESNFRQTPVDNPPPSSVIVMGFNKFPPISIADIKLNGYCISDFLKSLSIDLGLFESSFKVSNPEAQRTDVRMACHAVMMASQKG